jgi:hypothetical protein
MPVNFPNCARSSSAGRSAGPAVRDKQRQRVLVPRLHVDEVDVEPVEPGLELRQGVQSRLEPAHVVVGDPIARELPQHGQLHPLRRVVDELLVGPVGGRDALAKVDEYLVRRVDAERADFSICGLRTE